MSSTDASASAGTGLADVAARLKNVPRVGLIVGVALAATLLIALFLWSGSPRYGVLFSDLADADGGAVVQRLEQMQVPYEIGAGGSTIRVPQDRVDELRLQLAGDGLPQSGGVGFELMDAQPFGVSQFTEKVNYQRALEGELQRSITTLAGVSSARVQLALPESSVFVEERKDPKASIVVDLYRGRTLSPGQVQAIQNLVASAVTGLNVADVSIVDASGTLLTRAAGDGANGEDRRLVYTQTLEERYRDRINDLLAAIVGSDNVRTQIVANVDFAKRERTSENYQPNNNGSPAAVRSKRSNEDRGGGPSAGGIPGALSNQPTPEAPSPVNNPDPPENENGGLQSESALGLSDQPAELPSSRSDTINYELDRVIEHVDSPVGQIERISAAVVLNARVIGDENTPTNPEAATGDSDIQTAGSSVVALSAAQVDKIRDLVRGAIGYSETRGDQVEIIPMPFNTSAETPDMPTMAWWQDRSIQALGWQALKYLLVLIAVVLVWRALVRPVLLSQGLLTAPVTPGQATLESAEGSATIAGQATPVGESVLAGAGGEATAQAPAPSARPAVDNADKERREASLTEVREAAENDPRMVAAIVKGWMKEDG